MVVLWEDHYLLHFSDIFIIKMENDVVIPSKPIFYHRFIDDIYSRRSFGDNALFDRSNSYHPNSELTIEVNPSRFLEPNSPTSMVPINSTSIGKTQNYLHPGPPKLQNAIIQIQSMVIFIFQKEHQKTLTKKSLCKRKVYKG